MPHQSPHFSENDIRPKKLMDAQEQAVKNDLKRLLTFEKDFVSVPCPACGGEERRFKYKKNNFTYVDCLECKTFYINPRPTPEILSDFLKNSENYEYWSKYIFPASEKVRREKIFIPRVDRILEICERHGVKTEALLEVGAGFGTFCEEMILRNVFKRVVGVEPSPEWAKNCRKRGIETIEALIEDIDSRYHNIFDVVVNFEVIEHLFSPRDFIIQCQKFLKPKGLLVITCPNGEGFDVETLGTLSETVDHEHLNYFNPTSLSRLMQECGFRVLESQTPGVLDAELVRNQVLSGNFNLDHKPLFKHLLIDEWEKYGEAFQQFLIEHNLSSNMWLIAQKS